jgi:hypothetical protein
MKRLSILFLLYLSAFLFYNFIPLPPQYNAVKTKSVSLNVGDSIDFHNYYLSNEICWESSSKKLIDFKASKELNDPALKAQNTPSNNAGQLADYVNTIQDNRCFALLFNQSTISFPDVENYEKFDDYYKKLFQMPAMRKILFDAGLNTASEIIRKYPTSYKNQILQELDKLLLFTKGLSAMSYSEYGQSFDDYWEGFIYRRYFTSKVSLAEIQSYLEKAKSTVQGIKPAADFFMELRINNDLTVYYSEQGYVLQSVSTKREMMNTTRKLLQIKKESIGRGKYAYRIKTRSSEGEWENLLNPDLTEIESE